MVVRHLEDQIQRRMLGGLPKRPRAPDSITAGHKKAQPMKVRLECTTRGE